MAISKPTPTFPLPPNSIPSPMREYLQNLVLSVQSYAISRSSPTELVGASLILLQPPESGAESIAGTVWIDGNGFLKIVRDSDAFAAGFGLRVSLGTVTVTTA